jgi:hypothetical protein
MSSWDAAGLVDGFFESSWGKIRLLASQFHTDNSRTQVVHELSSGDVHPVQDRGLRARRVRVKLLFVDFVGLPDVPSGAEGFQIFKAAVDSGARATFVHPLGESFEASVGDFTYEVDESSIITVDAEFIQEGEVHQSWTPATANAAGSSGEAEVDVAAERVDASLAELRRLKIAPAALSQLLATLPRGRSLSLDVSLDATVDLSVEVSASLTVSAKASASASASAAATATVSASATASASASAAAAAAASGSASAAALASATAMATASATASAGAYASAYAYAGATATASAIAASEVKAGRFAALTIDARVAVASWSLSEEPPTRQILNDVARISDNIATMIEVGGFERDLSLWPAMRASIMLGESVRSAAIAATSRTPSVFLMQIMTPTALLPLAARIYGGEEAFDRARQIANLNDIGTPGWLTPGAYVMPTRSPAQRSPF